MSTQDMYKSLRRWLECKAKYLFIIFNTLYLIVTIDHCRVGFKKASTLNTKSEEYNHHDQFYYKITLRRSSSISTKHGFWVSNMEENISAESFKHGLNSIHVARFLSEEHLKEG